MMGSPGDELCHESDEIQHQVTLTRSFYLLDHEVTQADWREVMGTNPSSFQGDRRPADRVTWYDCVDFCNAKSERDGYQPVYTVNGSSVTWDATKNGYRLPTEAEWEYACRAGTSTAFYNGGITECDQDACMDQIGWYKYNSGGQAHDVMGKTPNAYGLYDMSGSVWEWCWDWHSSYPADAVSDPTGPGSGGRRVRRGGTWGHYAQYCRSAYRDYDTPDHGYYVGFRLARTAP